MRSGQSSSEEQKNYQKKFEEYMHKLRVMENYLKSENKEENSNLLEKIGLIKDTFSNFAKEGNFLTIDSKEFSLESKHQLLELIAAPLTAEEKAELQAVTKGLQTKKTTENQDYQWIKECFEELEVNSRRNRKSLISFIKDFISYIDTISSQSKNSKNAPVFFKPPQPVWTKNEEIAAKKEQVGDHIKKLEEKYSLRKPSAK